MKEEPEAMPTAISEAELTAMEQRAERAVCGFVTSSPHIHGGTDGRIETTYATWQALCDMRREVPRLTAEVRRLRSELKAWETRAAMKGE